MRVFASLVAVGTVVNACEVPPCTKCSGQKIDIAMILDHSGSIGVTNWGIMKSFSLNFIDATAAEFQQPYYGFSRFSGTAVTDYTGGIDQSMTSNIALVKSAITNTGAPAGWTPTPEGIRQGCEDLLTNGRPGVNKVAVVVTDGIPRDAAGIFPPNFTTDMAKKYKDKGVLMITVGVNIGTDLEAKKIITDSASDPKEFFAIPDVPTFQTLIDTTIPQLLGLMCFYVEQITAPGCLLANKATELQILGDGFLAVSPTVKCRSKDNNKLSDPNVAWDVFPAAITTRQRITCQHSGFPAPGKYVVEVSRDGGVGWSSNGQYVVVNDYCSGTNDGVNTDGTVNDNIFVDFSAEDPRSFPKDDVIGSAASSTVGIGSFLALAFALA